MRLSLSNYISSSLPAEESFCPVSLSSSRAIKGDGCGKFKIYGRLGAPWWLSAKESTCQCRRCRRLWFDPWVRKIPWKRECQPIPVFLPGKSHRQRSLVGYSPWGWRVRHDWAPPHTVDCSASQPWCALRTLGDLVEMQSPNQQVWGSLGHASLTSFLGDAPAGGPQTRCEWQSFVLCKCLSPHLPQPVGQESCTPVSENWSPKVSRWVRLNFTAFLRQVWIFSALSIRPHSRTKLLTPAYVYSTK